jgi:EAL domain-containing protein (putative c-di-GMP-specific phosphodiesterase class I)
LLVVVLETADRPVIDACIARLCASLQEPIQYGDATFQLSPYAGAAILGVDSSSPKALLEQALAASAEARRSDSARILFFSDTMKLRSLQRLDIARELELSIRNGDIRLRYIGRHDLATGRLVAVVGYMHWNHSLRGPIPPREFLGVAESTGLSAALSRSVLKSLNRDFTAFGAKLDPQVRLSFGALRHHVFGASFLSDVQEFLAGGGVEPGRLELRIGERSYVTQKPEVWRALQALGVQLTVDEIGREMSSIDLLARAPLWGLQLDRSWVTALELDPAAERVCRAVMSMARALGLTPIATGVDDGQRRERLLELGCAQGLGDLYPATDTAIGSARTAAARSSRAARHGSPPGRWG